LTSLSKDDQDLGYGCEHLSCYIIVSWPWLQSLTGLFKTKAVISSTLAHADFVKTLLVVPSLQLLVSGSSDKSVRFWSVL